MLSKSNLILFLKENEKRNNNEDTWLWSGDLCQISKMELLF